MLCSLSNSVLDCPGQPSGFAFHSINPMSDEVEFQMIYPCYFLCGDRGGLVCITVNFVLCLCLFTHLAKLHAFQQSQSANAPPDLAFPLEVAFATCHNASELIDRLNAAENEFAASKVD